MERIKGFKLKISLKDWIFILILSIIFAGVNSALIYLLLYEAPLIGLKVGLILGGTLGFFSFSLVSFNNSYLLAHIKNMYIWWILSAIASFFAGFLGFIASYFIVKKLSFPIPEIVHSHLFTVATIIGLLNYLTGLIIFLFVRMGKRKEEIEGFLLSAQIQSTTKVLESHFLVNTLNNIIELIHTDPISAEEYFINFTKFLREIIKMDPLIPIEQELDIIKKYIYFENLRKGKKIQFKKTFEKEGLKTALIPKLSLQVLVENALFHGYDGRSPFILEFVAKQRGEKLNLILKNNGLPLKNFKKGVGLQTLEKRINLYGGKFEVLSQNPPVFLIELPLRSSV